MSSLTLAIVLQAALAAPVEPNYRDAYTEATHSGKPLVVLVGADWCPGCRTMHHSTMPQAAQRGMMKDVTFAQVNTDHDSQLARQLLVGGSIPQLVMFYQTPEGWQKKHLTGAQSLGSIESFLKVGVDASATVRRNKANGGAGKVAQTGEKVEPKVAPSGGK
jgi:thioredoxin-like negative regulator of GroEL